MRALVASFVLWAALQGPAMAQEPALATSGPTPADLNVGCYLLVRGTSVPRDDENHAPAYSAETCGVIGVMMIAQREGKREGQTHNFCMPDTAEIDANPSYAMAYAYLDFYKANAARLPPQNGIAVFIIAMEAKWPCDD